MINLIRDEIDPQVMVMTLNDKLPCDTFCYTPVFKFQNVGNGELKYFTAQDISSFTTRYNYFQIELVDEIDENVLIGKIHLKTIGMWFYSVYKQPCGVIGIDIDSLEEELERGYMYLR
jgi:hypothetical protein